MNESSSILYYGTGTGVGGAATSIIAIGGTGAFLGLAGGLTQTAAGTYTFSGGATFSNTVALGASATATTPATSSDSTAVATTAFVKAQNYLTTNASITLSGDAADVYATNVSLWSTSYVFAAGHRVRVHVTSSNAPRFAPNPNTGASFSRENVTAATAVDIPG